MTVDANNGPSWSEIERPYSSLMASGAGAGIFVGGWVANASSKRDPGYKASPISGLLKYNFTTKEITNTSVTGVAMAGNSQMGGMHYVPNFGPQGLFLSLGGQQIRTSESRSDRYLNMSYVEIYNPETGKWDVGQSALDPETYLNMTYVQIYDPATGKWHEQKTSGHPPEPRKEFCIAGIASQSNTYEILVYAGWNGDLGPRSIPFDGAYVLSLPSFRWIKAEYEARSPRHALSCDSVGGAQILVVGGVDTLHGGPQDPYDAVFEAKDPFAQGLIIFNMSSLSWEVSYVAKPHPYDHTSLLRQWYSSKLVTDHLAA